MLADLVMSSQGSGCTPWMGCSRALEGDNHAALDGGGKQGDGARRRVLLPVENISLPTQILVEDVVAPGGGGDREARSAPLRSISVRMVGPRV